MKLTYKKGKQDKIHISVDGEYSFTVDEAYFLSMGIYNGKEVDDDELQKIKQIVSVRRAYNYAVALLSRRDHSEKELMTKLTQKGYSDGAEEAITKLRNGGYVSDERFARLYVRELQTLKRYGKRRIEQELYRKGIDREIIREVLDETEFEQDELVSLIERKYGRYLSDEKGVQKAVNGLLRMGYSYGEIRDALKQINENLQSEDEVYYE
ncbi:MAG: regulatory protein RecX [Clostridia bacterium]|nr:regulatory protein RecX [Clostridia bacterium]MBO7318693.1 regulatory protein RecX [Clostridia bacterium]